MKWTLNRLGKNNKFPYSVYLQESYDKTFCEDNKYLHDSTLNILCYWYFFTLFISEVNAFDLYVIYLELELSYCRREARLSKLCAKVRTQEIKYIVNETIENDLK